MHILTLASPLDLAAQGVLEPGRYLLEDVNAGQLLSMCWDASVDSTENRWWVNPNPRRILLIRPGGFGDLILLTPVIRALKEKYKQCEFDLACFPQYAPVYEGLGLCNIIRYPVLLGDTFGRYDGRILFENVIEHGEHHKTLHMSDAFAKAARVELTDTHAEYVVSEDEKSWADHYVKKHWPIPGAVKRIAVQTQASTHSRTYPQLGEVIAQLYSRGWHCFLLGSPFSIPIQNRLRITNCTLDNLTFRQSAAVLNACDIVLGPDSALIHVAGALGKPAVGLYGAFDYRLRTAYAPNTIALQGHGPCAPCFYHGRNGEHFPRNGPCHKVGKCVVLDSIKVDSVVQKVESHFKATQERLASSECASLVPPESPASSPS